MKYIYEDTAKAIVENLKGNWNIANTWNNQEDSPFKLIREDGLELFLSPPNFKHREKFEVYYIRPRDKKRCTVNAYDESNQEVVISSIKFTVNKTPTQMAKDITNRLLPKAEKAHVYFVEAVKKANDYIDKVEQTKQVEAELNSVNGVRFYANGSSIEISGYVSTEMAKLIHKAVSNI